MFLIGVRINFQNSRFLILELKLYYLVQWRKRFVQAEIGLNEQHKGTQWCPGHLWARDGFENWQPDLRVT